MRIIPIVLWEVPVRPFLSPAYVASPSTEIFAQAMTINSSILSYYSTPTCTSDSLRSQRSRLGIRLGDGFSALRGGPDPYTERIYINEWKAAIHNMHISNFHEEGRLESLQRQTETLKEELKKHDALKARITTLVGAFLRFDSMASDDQWRCFSTLPSQLVSPRPSTTGTSARLTYSRRPSNTSCISIHSKRP